MNRAEFQRLAKARIADASCLLAGKRWSAASVLCWTESIRYGRRTRDEAEKFYRAVTEPKDGILTWLKTHW